MRKEASHEVSGKERARQWEMAGTGTDFPAWTRVAGFWNEGIPGAGLQ